MTTDDPRHGTKAGYQAGCRNECCRHAQMVHQKRWRMGKTDHRIPNTGTLRRVQALKALGYTNTQIGALINKCPRWANNVAQYPTLLESIATAFAEAYDRASMSIPEGVAAKRARMKSARLGYAPPLAWDNIDDPNETPNMGDPEANVIDEVKVERVLKGIRQDCNPAERQEVLDRWEGSANELIRITGWNLYRMTSGKAA